MPSRPSTPSPDTAVGDLQSPTNNPQPGLTGNPGKQAAVFSDDHPYFPTTCRQCPFYNPSLINRLRNIIINHKKDCYHCQYIDEQIEEIKKKKKSQTAIEKAYYLNAMLPLLDKKVTVNGNGHEMRVGFSKYGNKHLYSDTFGRCHGINKEDLANLDDILASATFIKKAALSKPRKDNIKRFYYYRATVNENTVYLNVAETDFLRPNGKLFHSRFLYSVTDQIKK